MTVYAPTEHPLDCQKDILWFLSPTLPELGPYFIWFDKDFPSSFSHNECCCSLKKEQLKEVSIQTHALSHKRWILLNLTM